MTDIPPSDPARSNPSRTGSGDQQVSMTRSEERLRITTERVPVARAVLRKVIVVEQRTITVEVAHEEVRLETVPLEQDGDAAGGAHLALPELVLHEEQLVVTKRIVPVERVRPIVVAVAEERTVSEPVRIERISVVDGAQGD